jgi:hypothetical protein
MRFLAGLLLLTPIMASYGRAADVAKPGAPVLVELFTSEGCSSCPPADALLGKMDATQPIPGAQLIVLSEHVDYWDGDGADGWKDHYSSSLFTERQSAYCQALRLNEAYTPQMIVDGSAVLKISDPRQMDQVFEKAAAEPKISVTLGALRLDGSVLHGHLQANAPPSKEADVYVAVALDHADTEVLRGENKGRHVAHTAVVEQLKKIGKLEPGTAFDQDFQLKLKKGENAGNLRVVAFVQQRDAGRIVGATLAKPPLH